MDILVRASEKEFRMCAPDVDRIGGVLAQTGQFYEHEMLDDLGLLLSPGDVVLDVGANIGNHSVFFAGMIGCRVYAFEPNDVALPYLARNIELNGLSSLIKVYPVAVGSEVGRAVQIQTIEGNLGATRFQPSGTDGVEMLTIDSIGFSERIRLIKIDVEGMDLEVVRGGVETLMANLPYVIMECQDLEEFQQANSWMEARGYSALACYNATDTYLFVHLEARIAEPGFVRILCRQVLRSQLLGRNLRSSVRKIWRRIEAGE
jgi:FkbM family methyltransferase